MTKKQINGLAKKAKTFRTQRGWTQLDLAAFCKVSRPTIARLEAGTPLSDRKAGIISKAIGA